MSWAEIKRAVNSTLGTNEFNPLDKIVKLELSSFLYDFLVLGSVLFSDGSDLKYIVVEPNTQEITDSQYAEKDYIAALLPASVEKIGDFAFYNTPIRYINLPEGLTSIGDYAFQGCDLRYGVTIPSGITEIPTDAFRGSNVTKVTFSEGLKKIGQFGFYGCSKIGDLEFPDSLEEIDEYAFQKCSTIQSVRLGKNIKSINRKAFRADYPDDMATEIYDVYYAGTEEEWQQINGNDVIWGNRATIHYNYVGD